MFSAFSISALAQYPFDDQIIQDAGIMAATGQGMEQYLDQKPKNNFDAPTPIVKESCINNIELCNKEARQRKQGYQ